MERLTRSELMGCVGTVSCHKVSHIDANKTSNQDMHSLGYTLIKTKIFIKSSYFCWNTYTNNGGRLWKSRSTSRPATGLSHHSNSRPTVSARWKKHAHTEWDSDRHHTVSFLTNITELLLFHRHSLRAQIHVDDGHDLCNSLNSGFILAKEDRHWFPYTRQRWENWTVL